MAFLTSHWLLADNVIEVTAKRGSLVIDNITPNEGDTVTVRVLLDELKADTTEVTGGIDNRASWPITLQSVTVPVDGGFADQNLGGDHRAIIGQPQTFQSWSAMQFTAVELADTTISDWTAAPNGDGQSNSQEHFQGSSALKGDGQTLSGAVYLTGAGEEIPLIQLQRAVAHQAID